MHSFLHASTVESSFISCLEIVTEVLARSHKSDYVYSDTGTSAVFRSDANVVFQLLWICKVAVELLLQFRVCMIWHSRGFDQPNATEALLAFCNSVPVYIYGLRTFTHVCLVHNS